jgi:hypothetical protein
VAINSWQNATSLVGISTGIIAFVTFVVRPPVKYIEITLISIVAILVFILSIYHWTHNGEASGIMEMAAFCILTAAAVIAGIRK